MQMMMMMTGDGDCSVYSYIHSTVVYRSARPPVLLVYRYLYPGRQAQDDALFLTCSLSLSELSELTHSVSPL